MLRKLVLGLLLCVSSLTGSAWAATITIAVSTTPLSTPFYVAEKQGYFRAEGLDVALADCAGGNVCLKQLVDGQVPLATASDLPLMFRSFEKTPFRILATFAGSSQDVKLVARKSAGIKSSKDLKGKHVALVRGAAGQYFFDLTLLADGLDPRSATIVDLDLKQLEQVAANRQIDAFALWQPGAQKLVKLLGDDAFVLPTQNLYSYTFNLVAQRGAGSVSEADLVKVLRALDRAMGFIQSDPAGTRAIVQERLKIDADDMAVFWPHYRFSLGLNQSLISTMESTARWAMREALVKSTELPNYLDYIDVGPLRQVRPAAVTVVK